MGILACRLHDTGAGLAMLRSLGSCLLLVQHASGVDTRPL